MKKPPILDSAIILTDQQIGPIIDWATAFGNDRPVQIEIGPGKGAFLLKMARAHREMNFLGIEWANEFFKYCADRMRRWGISNVRILRTDARDFIIRRTPADSVLAIHVYYPDPWPKKKHHKRRLFIPPFCQAVGRVLIPGGRIAVATDHEPYFQQIKENLSAVPNLQVADFPDDRFGAEGSFVQTNYERKWLAQGKQLYRIAMTKRVDDPR